MKIQALFGAIATVFLINSVSAEWLDPTSDASWADYCTPDGSLMDQVHVCYVSDAATIDALSKVTHKGYRGTDGHFVLLPLQGDSGPAVKTGKSTLEFERYHPKYGGETRKCTAISIKTGGKETKQPKYCAGAGALGFPNEIL